MGKLAKDLLTLVTIGGVGLVFIDLAFSPPCKKIIPLFNWFDFQNDCAGVGSAISQAAGKTKDYLAENAKMMEGFAIDRPFLNLERGTVFKDGKPVDFGELTSEQGLSDSIHDLINKVLKSRTDVSAATTQKTDSTKDDNDSKKDTGSSSKSKGSPFDSGSGAPRIIAPKKRQVNQPKGETALSRMIEQALKSGETADMEKSSTPSKGTLDEWINNAITGVFRPYPSTVAGARAQQNKAVGNDIIENFLEWYGNGVNWLGQQITQHVENVQKQNEDIFKFLGIPTSPSPMLKPLIPIPVLP